MKKFFVIFAITLCIVLAAAPSYYFYRKYQTLQKQVSATETKDDIAAPAGSIPAVSAPTPTPIQISSTFTVLDVNLTNDLVENFLATFVSKVPKAQIVARGNAKGDYTHSLLVDVSGTHKNDASILAKTFGFVVSSLPAREAAPSSDFLIILVRDQQ